MVRRLLVVALALVLVAMMAGPALGPAQAQGDPDGVTNYPLNMRGGPGVDYAVIAVLDSGTGMIFEARNEDLSWLLGHTADGSVRGWVASLYLSYRDGFISANLPLSDEVVAVAPAAPAAPDAPAPPTPLDNVPVVPSIGPRVYEIFRRGQALGNNPRVFAKAGDCNTHSLGFMGLYGRGQYSLGAYAHLQATIDWFMVSPAPGIENPYWHVSAASNGGYTAATIMDPAWANPSLCPAGGALLACEFDRLKPSVVLIMFGLGDVHYLSEGEYDAALRRVVEYSIERGVIPVLTTFPAWSGEPNPVMYNKRLAFNSIVVNVGAWYGIPVMNLWRATQALPNDGLEDDLIHLTYSGTETGRDWLEFGGEQDEYGFTMWNLVALQTLDALRRSVLAN